jgi:hypothetical protein
MLVHIRSIALLAVSLSFGAESLAADIETDSQPRPLAECATGKGGRLLEVPVRIGAQACLFVVDTGCSQTCFGTELKGFLGPSLGKQIIRTHGGTLEVERHRCPPATWLGLDLQLHAQVMTTDLTQIRQASGRRVDGILGMDVLQHYVIRLDFDAGRLQIFPPIANCPQVWGERIPLKAGSWLTPAISLALGDSIIEGCHVDTGANVSTMTPAIAEELSPTGQFRFFRQNAWSTNPAGRARSRSGRLAEFTVAGLTAESARFDVSSNCSLGLNVLSRFHLTLDFPGQAMHVLPGRRLHEGDSLVTSGLAIVWVNSQLRVLAVQPGSAAESAGLKEGDVIQKIDHFDTQGMDSFSVGRLLTSEPGKQLRIVLGGDAPREVSLQLAARKFAP